MNSKLRNILSYRQRRRAREGRLIASIHYGLNCDHLMEIGFENYPLPLLLDAARIEEVEAFIADFKAKAALDDARGNRVFERSERLAR